MFFFRKKIAELSTIIMRNVLLLTMLVSDCVLGDVIPLPIPESFVAGAPAMGAVPTENTFGAFVLANVTAIPPPENALFVVTPPIAWQMLGYAAFFPEGGAAAQLYAAQKRQFVTGANVANNNPLAGGDLFNYSTNMHTERQLTIAVLEQQLSPIPIATAADVVIQGAMKVPATAPIGIPTLRGSLHVYTPQNPCQNATAENGNFSCINYYNNLAAFAPNVHLDIYFSGANMRLNRDFIRQTPRAANALCDFIQVNPVGHFQTANGWLQYSDAHGEWKNLVQQNPLGGWDTATAIKNGKINILVREVNNRLAIGMFNNSQIDQMFNNVHMLGGTTNLVYHAI